MDLKNPDQKRKSVDEGDPHTRFTAKVAERSGMFKSCIWCISCETFDFCIMFHGSVDTGLFFLQMFFSLL